MPSVEAFVTMTTEARRMRSRVHRGWMTRFGQFVAEVSVTDLRSRLVDAGLPVTSGMVYSWVAGRRSPRLPVVAALVGMAAGRVSLEDIVKHPEEVRNGAVDWTHGITRRGA